MNITISDRLVRKLSDGKVPMSPILDKKFSTLVSSTYKQRLESQFPDVKINMKIKPQLDILRIDGEDAPDKVHALNLLSESYDAVRRDIMAHLPTR